MASFREQAVALVKEAVRLDEQERFQEAYSKYVRALDYFVTYVKYEKNEKLKDMVRVKMAEYMSRAERLKEYLDSGAAAGGASEGGPSSGGGEAEGEPEGGDVDEAGMPRIGRRRTRDELLEYLGGESLSDVLHRRVVGQNVAVDGVARGIMRAYEGWRMGESPLVFLLAGPSGVGKTELAKAIAEALLGSASAIVRLDLSEFQEKHSVSKILGAPAGYVGSADTPYFADELRKNPSTVVLLDECEKAHEAVITMWLGVFDDGRFTPSSGDTIHCSDTVFILTSNLGSDVITAMAPSNPTLAEYHAALEPILKAHFKRDELLGRIDEILPFEPFTTDSLTTVIELFLSKWVDLAAARHDIELTFDVSVLDAIIAQYNPKYGVRSVKHIIEREVGNVLADASARGVLTPGCAAAVGVDDGAFIVVPEGRRSAAGVLHDDRAASGSPLLWDA